jgi:hypothetical protein
MLGVAPAAARRVHHRLHHIGQAQSVLAQVVRLAARPDTRLVRGAVLRRLPVASRSTRSGRAACSRLSPPR